VQGAPLSLGRDSASASGPGCKADRRLMERFSAIGEPFSAIGEPF